MSTLKKVIYFCTRFNYS